MTRSAHSGASLVWRDGQLTQPDFGALNVWDSEAVAINDRRPHAQIVGRVTFTENGSTKQRAFLYENGQVTDLARSAA